MNLITLAIRGLCGQLLFVPSLVFLLCLYLNNNEESQLFTGKSLRLGGSKQLYEDNNTFFGDLSAILIDNMPIWAEFSSTPCSKTSLMGDWETKLPAIINETINYLNFINSY